MEQVRRHREIAGGGERAADVFDVSVDAERLLDDDEPTPGLGAEEREQTAVSQPCVRLYPFVCAALVAACAARCQRNWKIACEVVERRVGTRLLDATLP